MDGIGSVCVRAFVIPQLYCVQDKARDLLEVANAVCVFRQDCGAPGHRTVQDGHAGCGGGTGLACERVVIHQRRTTTMTYRIAI